MKHEQSDPGARDVPTLLRALLDGEITDPFAVLGPHDENGERHVTVLLPGARRVTALSDGREADLPAVASAEGLFSGPVGGSGPYRLTAASATGDAWHFDDPYRFGPVLDDSDDRRFAEGRHPALWRILGAHMMHREGVAGTHFAVWAPNARRVSVVGGFNMWDGRRHMMRKREASGIWEIFVPGVGEPEIYKYEIVDAAGTLGPLKADPYGFGSQHPPENASVVRDISGYGWSDDDWMRTRAGRNARTAPISIYEVHLASWRRRAEKGAAGRPVSYTEAAEELVDYAADMGFTHIELMPIAEYPFDGSWGYQPVGLYAPTVRHGPPHEFRDLIAAAHCRGLGVILDWVPGHFPTDPHGLGRFDGTALYEHADPREGFHPDWNTYIFDYGRPEVCNYLVSNALYWLEEYHADGLRVDAVASMLYRDYSRKAGEWVPNAEGGRENFEAIAMMREMNAATHDAHPGIMTVAEESTAWTGVTAAVTGTGTGLGYGYKWNMGWMHDTLTYMTHDPADRPDHHHEMTFGLTYAFDEAFVLPVSHDEVVHGKGSMLGRMPGDDAARFANLRAYYGFMWGHPGKKLLFMGQEFAQSGEWDHDATLDWATLDDPRHAGVQRLVRDLNTLYRGVPALHVRDAEQAGFRWIEADDTGRSVYAWLRHGGDGDADVAVICNMSTEAQTNYRVGLPAAGRWREALNTDAQVYDGQGRGNMGQVTATAAPSHGQPASAEVYLPPLSAIFLVHDH